MTGSKAAGNKSTGGRRAGMVLQERDRHLLSELGVMRIIDREMAKLTTNTLHYNGSVEILSRAFDQLKRTVSETQ